MTRSPVLVTTKTAPITPCVTMASTLVASPDPFSSHLFSTSVQTLRPRALQLGTGRTEEVIDRSERPRIVT
jgi:hypothetical protein